MKLPAPTMRLYSSAGERLYLNAEERQRFIAVAQNIPRPTRTLCLTLAYTGCRVSEALELTPTSLQISGKVKVIVVRSLKKRGHLHWREIPVPDRLAKTLETDHGLAKTDISPLWKMDRTTAWRQVKQVMKQASISGKHACPKGLRHGFAIAALGAGVPLNMVQKWMGHANIKVTAIYTNAVGKEEYDLAKRMW